jgi:hypothetical protein
MLLAAASTAILAVIVIGASSADASVANYCNNSMAPPGWFCAGTQRHSINDASGTVWNGGGATPGVCVSAQNLDGTQAGSWACGYPFADHTYCACQLRYPWISAPAPATESITGAISY